MAIHWFTNVKLQILSPEVDITKAPQLKDTFMTCRFLASILQGKDLTIALLISNCGLMEEISLRSRPRIPLIGQQLNFLVSMGVHFET